MSIARNVTTVGGATLLSRLLGFGRDVGIATMLGAGVVADAFFAVLQIVNFFRRLLAEGALNAAFVPSWLRIKQIEGRRGAFRFLYEATGTMLLVSGMLTGGTLLLAPTVIDVLAPGFDAERQAAATEYLVITAPYIALAGLVAILAAALNAEGRVLAVATGVVAFNGAVLAVLLWIAAAGVAEPTRIGTLLAHAIVLAGIAQLAVIGVGVLAMRPGGIAPRSTLSPEIRRFLAVALPGLVAACIPQLKLIAGATIASATPATVSWLYYANRLYELPLGVVSVATAAVLVPMIAASIRTGRQSEIVGAQGRSSEIVLGLTLPAATAFAVLATPIAAGLFEHGAFGPHDTTAVAAALAAMSAGLPGHALEKVLGAVSFAHEDARTPMLAALTGLAVAIIGALGLFPRYGHVGVAAAIAASGWVGATLLGVLLWRRRWLALDGDAMRRLPRIAVATILMGCALAGAERIARPLTGGSPPARILVLLVLVAGGLAVYLAGLQLLGVARLRDLVRAVRHHP